jgi:hypothetical protein
MYTRTELDDAVEKAIDANNKTWQAVSDRALRETVELREDLAAARANLARAEKTAANATGALIARDVLVKERDDLIAGKDVAIREAASTITRLSEEVQNLKREIYEVRRVDKIVVASYQRQINELVGFLGKKRRKKYADEIAMLLGLS